MLNVFRVWGWGQCQQAQRKFSSVMMCVTATSAGCTPTCSCSTVVPACPHLFTCTEPEAESSATEGSSQHCSLACGAEAPGALGVRLTKLSALPLLTSVGITSDLFSGWPEAGLWHQRSSSAAFAHLLVGGWVGLVVERLLGIDERHCGCERVVLRLAPHSRLHLHHMI